MKLKDKLMSWDFLSKAEKYISSNGSTISMVGSIVALAGALYAAYKASEDVVEANERYDAQKKEIENRAISDDEKAKELKILKKLRTLEIIDAEKWTLLLGGTSAGLTFLTKYLDGLTIAGLTTLVATQQDKIKSMAKNAKEMLGEEKFKEFEDKNLEDLVMRNFVTETGEPKAMKPYDGLYAGEFVVDTNTGVIFQIRKEDLMDAFEWGESECARNHGLTQQKWESHLGLPPTTSSKERVWGPKNPFKAHIGERTLRGMTLSSIEYEYTPRTAKGSGVPWA